MITDEQAREWVLQKLYDIGCKKITPYRSINLDCFINFNNEEVIDIAEELGIVDWATTPKGAHVLVDTSTSVVRRIFSHYASGSVYVFENGGNEWTSHGETVGYSEKCCTLCD